MKMRLVLVVILLVLFSCEKESSSAKLEFINCYDEQDNLLKFRSISDPSQEVFFDSNKYDVYELLIGLEVDNIRVETKPLAETVSSLLIYGNKNIPRATSTIFVEVISEDGNEKLTYKIKVVKK
jgi:hypothetical protein